MNPLLLGALIGLAKSEVIDKPKENRDRKLKAEMTRLSPWSKIDPAGFGVKEADPFGSALQGAGTAGAINSNMIQEEQNQKLIEMLQKKYSAGGTPWDVQSVPSNDDLQPKQDLKYSNLA